MAHNMEKVIYSNQGGLGIILNDHKDESVYFEAKEYIVNGEVLTPGTMTTLSGLYSEPLQYMGTLKDDTKCMVFKLGDESNLFDTKIYYSCIYWITELRVANKYKEGTARDFIFKNGKWK